MSFLQVCDMIIVIGLIIAAIIGFSKGLSKKLFNIASFAIAFLAVVFLTSPVLSVFGKSDADIRVKCLYIVGVFAVAFIFVRIIGAIVNKGISSSGLNPINRLLGMLFAVSQLLLAIWCLLLLTRGVLGIGFINEYISERISVADKGWGITLYLYEHNLIPLIVNSLSGGLNE